jgi:hypothetical protein
MGTFGLWPQLTVPKYWSCQLVLLLLGLLPIFWLPMHLFLIPSQSTTNILANPGRMIPPPNNWQANDWQGSCRREPNTPMFVEKKYINLQPKTCSATAGRGISDRALIREL